MRTGYSVGIGTAKAFSIDEHISGITRSTYQGRETIAGEAAWSTLDYCSPDGVSLFRLNT